VVEDETVKVARTALVLVLAGISAFMAYSYVTLPYEVITRTITTTQIVPGGESYVVLALAFAVLALVAAFSGDWT
jgi:hypothetical protein